MQVTMAMCFDGMTDRGPGKSAAWIRALSMSSSIVVSTTSPRSGPGEPSPAERAPASGSCRFFRVVVPSQSSFGHRPGALLPAIAGRSLRLKRRP